MATREETRTRLAEQLARPMTTLAFLFLVLVGLGIQRIAGPTYRDQPLDLSTAEIVFFIVAIGCLWLGFVVEFVLNLRCRDGRESFWRNHWSDLVVCLCPPLRMGKRSRVMNGQMWLPGLGWQTANDELRGRLERVFGLPMIGFALMILPILAVEHYLPKQVHPDKNLWLVILLDVSTAVIWVAFTTEFIVMASAAEEKFTYCWQHWLDLAIILLPLISFARALRLGRLGNMSRLYRLRGLALRAFRAVLLLDVFKRLLLLRPERRLARLQRSLGVKERELDQLYTPRDRRARRDRGEPAADRRAAARANGIVTSPSSRLRREGRGERRHGGETAGTRVSRSVGRARGRACDWRRFRSTGAHPARRRTNSQRDSRRDTLIAT